MITNKMLERVQKANRAEIKNIIRVLKKNKEIFYIPQMIFHLATVIKCIENDETWQRIKDNER